MRGRGRRNEGQEIRDTVQGKWEEEATSFWKGKGNERQKMRKTTTSFWEGKRQETRNKGSGEKRKENNVMLNLISASVPNNFYRFRNGFGMTHFFSKNAVMLNLFQHLCQEFLQIPGQAMNDVLLQTRLSC